MSINIGIIEYFEWFQILLCLNMFKPVLRQKLSNVTHRENIVLISATNVILTIQKCSSSLFETGFSSKNNNLFIFDLHISSK